jgi:hypothetical protein
MTLNHLCKYAATGVRCVGALEKRRTARIPWVSSR